MKKMKCLCLIVLVAAFGVSATNVTAQESFAPKKKWYQKVFKPLRNPFRRKQKEPQSGMDRNSANPFFEKQGRQSGNTITSDDPFAGRPTHDSDREYEIRRAEYTGAQARDRVDPYGNPISKAGYRQSEVDSMSRHQSFKGADGRRMVRNYTNAKGDNGYSSIENAVRPRQDGLARNSVDTRRGRFPREEFPGRDDIEYVPNAIGNGQSRIANSNPRFQDRTGQARFDGTGRDNFNNASGISRTGLQRPVREYSNQRIDAGRTQSSTTTFPNGEQFNRTRQFERDGDTFTREKSFTAPSGLSTTRTATRDLGDRTRSYERTTTLPNGNEVSQAGYYKRDGNTITSQHSLTGPNGQSISRTSTHEFNDGTRSYERTTTLPTGNQVMHAGYFERDGNTVTREHSITGPSGRTVTRAGTRDLDANSRDFNHSMEFPGTDRITPPRRLDPSTQTPSRPRSFFSSDGEVRSRGLPNDRSAARSAIDRRTSRTDSLPNRNTTGLTRGASDLTRGLGNRTASNSLTHRRPSMQGIRESTIQRRQLPPANTVRRTTQTPTTRASHVTRPTSTTTPDMHRSNEGTAQLQRARRAFRRSRIER